jgi:uncharacterized glyoxalase superfamily protein PhnB
MINKLHPLTITKKLNETAEFYKTYFEFKEVFTSDWYIQLAHKNGAEIALMLPDLPNQPDFLHAAFNGKGMVLTFETEDATKEYETLKEKGATFKLELRDEEWGQRHCMLEDPSGVYVDVVQYLS